VNVKFSKKKKENNSVYCFRERISLYSCDVVERKSNLMNSTSHGVIRNSISNKLYQKHIYKRNKKKFLMSENGLRKLFRINKIKIIISVTGLHNKATY
jgi:hypothetical protein